MAPSEGASGTSILRKVSLCTVLAHVTLLACVGCASDVKYATELEISAQDSGVEADALNSAVQTFIGRDVGGGSNGGPFDDVGSISSQPIEKTRSHAVTARLKGKRQISDGLFLVGAVSLSQGEGRYALPQGTDILTDPARISFGSTVANTSVGLAYVQKHRFGLSSEVSGGAGYRISRTNTRISSDLLAVDTTSTDGDAFLYLGAAAKVPASRHADAYLATRGRLYASGPVDLQISLGLAFE